jgi:hypothetical protein
MNERVETAQCELAEKSEGSFLEVLWVSTRLGLTSSVAP